MEDPSPPPPPSPAKTQPPPPPLDSDHKSLRFNPFSVSPFPHMLAFHLAWLSLFSCFFSTFSIPPLLPLIRRDLNLSQTDVANAGIASFLGAIFSRFAMGPACDVLGPRVASSILSLLTAPAVLAMSFVNSPVSFIVVRFLVGFSLANFVANQFWMSSMFSGNVVGLANAVSAGWANMGAGLSQLVMPLVYTAIVSVNVPSSAAWRLAFIFPSLFQVVTAIMVLIYGQDLPSGSFKEFKKSKKRNNNSENDNFFNVLFNGLTNYRGWILALTYGYCFGVELTVDNIIAEYFYDRFNVDIRVAGTIAASFGTGNLISRPMGGIISDRLGRRFGMRGRLWAVQTVAGFLCVLLGRVDSLWGSIAVMCVFSVFVQAASGLTFGVVPFVSKRSLGVISGMTGSGGTVGAVVTQLLLFSGSKYSEQTSISLMGLMIIGCTLPISFIYFPQWGGMFCGPSTDPDYLTVEDYHLLE